MITGLRTLSWLLGLLLLTSPTRADDPQPKRAESVRLAGDGKGFVLEPSGRVFVPWGFNYDHDESGRLIEDYWDTEWPKIVEDFHEMADLGANTVRVHLQFGKFMESPDTPWTHALDQLVRLLDLAGSCGLYLDLTGLGCYHKADVPAWYDALDEAGRWAAQARFWEAVADRCAGHPAVFCYDLMNEPVVSGGRRADGDWLGPAFAGKHFVQFIALDPKGRSRPEIALQWVDQLSRAIRSKDSKHLVTVGLVPWSLDRPGLSSGFVPEKIAAPLDFLCVHIYPEKGKITEAVETLKGFTAAGKPVVIEETFALKCSTEEFRQFVAEARGEAAGWIGFYWGKTLDDCKRGKTIPDALMASWLGWFHEEGKSIRRP